jgi:hypothetical protein
LGEPVVSLLKKPGNRSPGEKGPGAERKQPRLAENLKPVANPEHGSAGAGKRGDRSHDGREAGDRAGSQVIAVREPAWQHDDISAPETRLLVPDELGLLAEHVLGRVVGVVIAVGPGKDNDAEFHNHSEGLRPSDSLAALVRQAALLGFETSLISRHSPVPPVELWKLETGN